MITAAQSSQVPRPITPGAEMEALGRFHRDVTWEGFIADGGTALDHHR